MPVTGRLRADGPFGAIVATHHAEIRRYLQLVVSPETEADNLLQETFVRAFRGYRSLPAHVSTRSWLFAIATRLCKARLARDGGRPGREGKLQEVERRLENVIRDLPVKHRLAVTMRKLHDLDYDAIGASLACSAQTARTYVLQALRRLRRERQEVALSRVERRSHEGYGSQPDVEKRFGSRRRDDAERSWLGVGRQAGGGSRRWSVATARGVLGRTR